MKVLGKKLILLLLITLFSCSSSPAQKYKTRVTKIVYGITIFAFDKQTGEIQYNHTTGGKHKVNGNPLAKR